MAILGSFTKGVEAYLWKGAMGVDLIHATLDSEPCRPGMGTDKIYAFDDKLFSSETPDARLCLNYVGAVTRAPTTSSLPLCQIWGEQIYLEGNLCKSSSAMLIERFLLAWCGPLENTNSKKKVPQFVLQMEKIKVPFTYRYPLGAKKEKIKVFLDVFRLVVSESSSETVFSGTEKVFVVRQAVGDVFPTKSSMPTAPSSKKDKIKGIKGIRVSIKVVIKVLTHVSLSTLCMCFTRSHFCQPCTRPQ